MGRWLLTVVVVLLLWMLWGKRRAEASRAVRLALVKNEENSPGSEVPRVSGAAGAHVLPMYFRNHNT